MDVLLVEDEAPLREALAEYLTDCGLSLALAATAEEGLRLVEHDGVPTVLVTDLDLGPGIGGLKLAEIFAARWSRAGIVFISGRPWLIASHTLRPRERFLAKPFSAQDLLRSIQGLRKCMTIIGFFLIPML